MAVGRPLRYKTVEELQKLIDAYFEEAESKGEPYTITGLALALDTTRELLIDYENKDAYSYTIKKAKLRCHNYAEKFLYNGKNPTGAIFNLKNNWGWRDKSEVEAKIESVTPILGGASKEDTGNDVLTNDSDS